MQTHLTKQCMEAAVAGWDVMVAEWDEWERDDGSFGAESLNKFIETHEFTLLTFGEKITRGLRVKAEPTQPHETLDGVLGIVSLNIEIIRRKLERINKK